MPTQLNYRLPKFYSDNVTLIDPANIKQIDLGIRPKGGTPGVYPTVVADVTFTPDAQGLSHESLASFSLAPGLYIASARAVMKPVNGVAGGISDWAPESAEFPMESPKPNPPTEVTAS